MKESPVPEQESGESGIRNQGSGNQESGEHLSPDSLIPNSLIPDSQSSNHPTIQPSNLPAPRLAPITVLVGLTMLLVGLLLGYFGRPLVTPRPLESAVAAATAPREEAAASAENPTAGTFMDAIVAQTRHFRGNADAPVTIVEFGDFQ